MKSRGRRHRRARGSPGPGGLLRGRTPGRGHQPVGSRLGPETRLAGREHDEPGREPHPPGLDRGEEPIVLGRRRQHECGVARVLAVRHPVAREVDDVHAARRARGQRSFQPRDRRLALQEDRVGRVPSRGQRLFAGALRARERSRDPGVGGDEPLRRSPRSPGRRRRPPAARANSDGRLAAIHRPADGTTETSRSSTTADQAICVRSSGPQSVIERVRASSRRGARTASRTGSGREVGSVAGRWGRNPSRVLRSSVASPRSTSRASSSRVTTNANAARSAVHR